MYEFSYIFLFWEDKKLFQNYFINKFILYFIFIFITNHILTKYNLTWICSIKIISLSLTNFKANRCLYGR